MREKFSKQGSFDSETSCEGLLSRGLDGSLQTTSERQMAALPVKSFKVVCGIDD